MGFFILQLIVIFCIFVSIMRVYYKIHPDYIGKVHHDLSGATVLTAKLSQTVLKKLLAKGNKFVISYEK